MRARTRLLLDLALAAVFVVAFNPKWTGLPVHQWLSIAVIAPLVVHLVVNWEWAVRVIARFFKKLISVSRLNLVVDVALMVATVTVMLSGFMVSPALFAPLGIRFGVSAAWIALHSWSADATIALFALHAALHWRWALGVVRRWSAERSAARPRVGTAVAAVAVAPERSRRSRPTASAGASNRRGRAQQAAAERAIALRTVSALGLSVVVGAAVFVSVGLAQPSRAAAHASTKLTAGATQKCPVTGCTASTCHAASGAKAEAFYGRARVAAWKAKAASATQKLTSSVTTKRAPVRSEVSGGRSTADQAAARKAAKKAAARKAARKAAARKKAAAKKTAAKKAAAKKAGAKKATAKKKVRRQSCPVTGCSATTCHGAHGVSARVWYATH